jgi:hypothetical protein
MEVYVGDGPEDHRNLAMMNERLAEHFGDLVCGIKPQLDGDLDLVLRCYRDV